jgi:chromosomal replication initiator protein
MSEADLADVWVRSLAKLAGTETVPAHRAWLQLSRLLGLVENTALIATPNEFVKEQLETRLQAAITNTLSRELGRSIQLAVIVDPAAAADPGARPPGLLGVTDPDGLWPGPDEESGAVTGPLQRITDDAPPNAEFRSGGASGSDSGDYPVGSESADSFGPDGPGSGAAAGTLRSVEAGLNPKYTFETFVIGSSNRFAHAAAVAVAEAPAKAYNPLFIYSDAGLGKTHLLHAIGHYTQSLYQAVKVRYVSSEEFTNDFINMIRDGKQDAFRRRYRDVDVLMVDDIQFLEHKEGTQEEFFHTFNMLHNANKQIIITSGHSPKRLVTLDDRLRNRFEWGLVADVQPPELNTRIAILRKKAVQDQLKVPADALEYIASRISTNNRELEGALIRVAAFASLNRQSVDLQLAELVLKDLLGKPDSPAVDSPPPAASSASDDVIDPDLLFRVYIPSERLYAAEAGRLLALFRDWLVAIRGHGVRQSGYRTASGEMYEFFADASIVGTDLQGQFDTFSSFLTLCADNPSAAVDLLAGMNLGRVASSDLVSRFTREGRRLQVDLHHERERRLLFLRQSLEQELVENGVDLRQLPGTELGALFEKLVPGPSAPESLTLLAGPLHVVHTPPITVNISPQIVSTLESKIEQNVQGTVHLSPEAKEILSLIDRFAGDDVVDLRSAVHELEDEDARPADRSAARHRLQSFIRQLGGSFQEVGLGLVEKYLERRLGL